MPLFPENFVVEKVRLLIKLRPNKFKTKPNHPELNGYLMLSHDKLAELNALMASKPKDEAVFLKIALWTDKTDEEWLYHGTAELRDHDPYKVDREPKPLEKPQQSLWY